MTPLPAPERPRTGAAQAARRRTSEAALTRVHNALTWLRREQAIVSVAAVARRARVSRTFLYQNTAARAAVAAAIADVDEHRAHRLAAQDDHHNATWRERALNAEAALTAAHSDIRGHREHVAQLLGQLRDLENTWTDDAVRRLLSENTTLKANLGRLSAENRTLVERLDAARTNIRFQDRRLADLETRMLDTAPATPTTGPRT